MEAALMLLCDIGNTSYHFYDGNADYKRSVNDFDPAVITDDVYYISVNPNLVSLLEGLTNWKDLSEHIVWDEYYETMGIDRVVACEAVEEGVIIDAGSAVTVDIVRDGLFQGGFIYPGVQAMQGAYLDISARLSYSFNFELDLDRMPKNSPDAISYGYLRTLYSEVKRHTGPYYITGGDAELFSRIFPMATVERHLIFRGMQKIMSRVPQC